jgi:microcystin-dependent protein
VSTPLIFGPQGVDDEQIQGKPPPSTRFLNWLHARVSTNRPEDTHHRLGYGPTDAAPGNHTHDGRDSSPIPVAAVIPTGFITPWYSDEIPSWGLELNGQAVSRATYSALFSLWGTTFGAGDGSTTFNLPDMKGRVMVGVDGTQAEFNTLGETGGEKTHTLTATEMPSHTHGTGVLAPTVFGSAGGTYSARVATNPASGITTTATGGDGAHNNLQPYLATRFVVVSGVTT